MSGETRQAGRTWNKEGENWVKTSHVSVYYGNNPVFLIEVF
jgi:hypothetical protein